MMSTRHALSTKGHVLLAAVVAASATPFFASGGAPEIQPSAGDPLNGLTPDELELWEIGRAFFLEDLPLVPGSSTVIPQGGVGPIFNKASCGNCHANPVGGPGSQTVTRFGLVTKKGFDPLGEYGGSLHQLSTIDVDGICADVLPERLDGFHSSFRVTNGALAYGLVEAIPDAAILAVKADQALNHPGQEGVAHMVEAFEDPKGSPLRVGRFGWKAQVATVLTFSADASLNEMGLTNRFLGVENDPNGIFFPDLGEIDNCDDGVEDPDDFADEDGFHFIDRVTHFQRGLAAPPQTPKSGMTGEALFEEIGCAVCHTPSFTTATEPFLYDDATDKLIPVPDAIAGKVIKPYSDFMLHHMTSEGDFIVQGAGDLDMLKTPPLWGIRTRDPMWHDGRVGAGSFESRILRAVAFHCGVGSQAAESAGLFLNGVFVPDCEDCPTCVEKPTPEGLNDVERGQVIAFLNSLGRTEFDSDFDDFIDAIDLYDFIGCMTEEGVVSPDDDCAIHDFDQDGDVDLIDAEALVAAYDGPHGDCDGSRQDDLIDIILGKLADKDMNGIPDKCEQPGDVDGDGDVDPFDLALLLGTWGLCPGGAEPCPADFNDDGLVNPSDLAILLGAWTG